MIKKLSVLLLALLILGLISAFYIVKSSDDYLAQRLSISKPQQITIHSGTSLNGTLSLLMKKGWIDDNFAAKLIRHLHPELTQIKAGTYQLLPDMSLQDSLTLLVSGREFQFAITFVEGSRFSDWREILANTSELKQTINNLSEAEIAQQLGLEHKQLEGLFLAETYHFTKGEVDIDILKRAHRKLDQTLTRA